MRSTIVCDWSMHFDDTMDKCISCATASIACCGVSQLTCTNTSFVAKWVSVGAGMSNILSPNAPVVSSPVVSGGT